jgi:arsenical pump membrane protein
MLVVDAVRELWRPLLAILAIMTTTSCASELGVFARLAAAIEPRTRGPVRHAFRLVFMLAALTAATLSNDAAILLVTPVILELLRAVYPRRNPKFLVPFAFAVFAAAGVAPLPTGNPMNLVVAERAGISFNAYVVHMLPVALVGWVVAYAALAWYFRDALADEAPALGEAPPVRHLTRHARIVLLITGASLVSYPILAALGQRVWPVATLSAFASLAVTASSGITVRRIARGISWELVPFLLVVFVVATLLARAGVTATLADLYTHSPAPLPTVGTVAAAGSALLNNHPMALLHSIALTGAPDRLVYAALVGGDLGPRLLPIGSLAGILWLHSLRRAGVHVPLTTFVRVGLVVTVPSLIASLGVLWILAP